MRQGFCTKVLHLDWFFSRDKPHTKIKVKVILTMTKKLCPRWDLNSQLYSSKVARALRGNLLIA